MLCSINNLIKEYDPLIKLIWAIFPFVVTIIMAYIAYQQYKLVHFKMYCEFMDKLEKNFISLAEDFEKDFDAIIESKETNKIRKIIDLFISYEPRVAEYEKYVNKIDIQFIKDSYTKAKKWFIEYDKFELNCFYLKNSFHYITDLLASLFQAKSIFEENPATNILTVYGLIGGLIKRITSFFIPVFIQKIYKKHIRQFFFKIKAVLYMLKLFIEIGKELFCSKKEKVKENAK